VSDKFIPCNSIHDEPALLAEIIITLRACFGMKPATYSDQLGGLTVPDDYSMPEEKPAFDEDKFAEALAIGFRQIIAEELASEEPPTEELEAKAPKKETKPKGK